MGTLDYMHSSEAPTYQLLALAVFADSLRTAYLRSIHVHEENLGSFYKIQQEFLLNPGEYVRLGEPLISQSFQVYVSDAGTKQTMDTIIRMHLNEGWHCVLDYQRDSPSETIMPHLLSPSRNVDLKRVPGLEQDLKLVESALMSSMRNSHNMLSNQRSSFFNQPWHLEGKSTEKDKFARISSGFTLSFPSNLTRLEHLNNRLPGLETPERTPPGQRSESWQSWGSELELASPDIARTNSSSRSHQATLRSSSPASKQKAGRAESFWNPSTLPDLNSDATENSPKDRDIDCTLGLSSPVPKLESCLNLQLGMPALSLQQSAITEEDSMDCITLDSHGDSPYSHSNMVGNPDLSKPTKAMAAQGESKPLCSSEDSIDWQGCVINMSPWDMKGDPSGVSRGRTKGNNGGGRASCSSINTQSVRQGPWKAYGSIRKKHRIMGMGLLRPTSERLHEITVQEITKYFSVPITQAAKELKVGLTVLKKRCRHLGISRWPHRKMKSIDSLINNVQDLAEDQGVEGSPRVQSTVKELEEQKKLMEEMPEVELAERTKKLRQACFKANYKRRKLGAGLGNIPCNPLSPFSPSSAAHSFNMLTPSGTLVIPPPFNHRTMDHFV